MTDISVRTDIAEVTRWLTRVQKKQIPFATSKTLNDLAYQIARKEMPKEADDTFEGGATPWTKRGFRYKRSTKRHLVASVYVNPDTHKYMSLMVHGGVRTPERKALLIGTDKVRRNRYGNITRGMMQKMINDESKYFKGKPRGKPSAPEGIWERYARGRRIKLLAVYKPSARYSKTFKFVKITEDYVKDTTNGFVPRFKRNLAAAIASAR